MLGRRRTRLAGVLLGAVVLIAALVVATSGSATSGQRLSLRADASGALKFNKKKLTAKPGKATIVMTNPSSSGLKHAIEVEGHGIEKDGKTVGPGGKSRVTVKLKVGKYEFYCPVDGHKAGGMKGTIVVRK
jgi:plastocyanin